MSDYSERRFLCFGFEFKVIFVGCRFVGYPNKFVLLLLVIDIYINNHFEQASANWVGAEVILFPLNDLR